MKTFRIYLNLHLAYDAKQLNISFLKLFSSASTSALVNRENKKKVKTLHYEHMIPSIVYKHITNIFSNFSDSIIMTIVNPAAINSCIAANTVKRKTYKIIF